MISFWISVVPPKMDKTLLKIPRIAALERGADPSIRDELIQADADGWLHMLFAARWHDPVAQQIHDLIQSRKR
jgi:hypothetical protein